MPNPGGLPNLVATLNDVGARPFTCEVRAIPAPTLLVFGDSDIVVPEHAIERAAPRGGVPERPDRLLPTIGAVLIAR